jgi:hypothetical protein
MISICQDYLVMFFDFLVVEPGMNTLIYPLHPQLVRNYANIAIIREPIEASRNEIAYFAVE